MSLMQVHQSILRKEQVKEVFRKVTELNAILDKYDIDVDVDWSEYITAYDHYFGMTWY